MLRLLQAGLIAGSVQVLVVTVVTTIALVLVHHGSPIEVAINLSPPTGRSSAPLDVFWRGLTF